MLDLLTGGYPTDGLTVIRFFGDQLEAGIVQEFMERQALSFSMRPGQKLRTLLCSLQMNERDAARSLAMTGKRLLPDIAAMMEAQLELSFKQEGETPGQFTRHLRELLKDKHYEVVIIDGIDEFIEEGFSDEAEEQSRQLALELVCIAHDARVPVIVTDYANRLESDFGDDGDDVMEITLNSDINDRTQAVINQGRGRSETIEDIYIDADSVGIELVRSALSYWSRTGALPGAGDELGALVNAAAAVIAHIDELLKGGAS